MQSLAARTILRSPVALTIPRTFSRSLVTLKSVKYTATSLASGAGRNGQVKSGDLSLKLAMPKELGGAGDGANPEQLFGMGYAACFLSALNAVARNQGKADAVKNASVAVDVSIGEPSDKPGFGLAVDLKVSGADDALIKAAHEMCPYSRALSEGVVVNVSKA
ncbi:OsmC/Ohr family [Schizophyllum fasciatum]